MASSSRPKRTYDVFLSFRGTDVRRNFLGHLFKALDQNGIYTFIDNEELRKGDQISPELMQAIDESCIAIIVFSENYVSSRWCLEELAKIMECKEQKELTVLPVFYKVDPRNVRGGCLAMHESKLGNDSEKVQRWKKALFDAGSLSGWHLNDEDESELIQKIVKEISTRLARTLLHVAKHLIGIDSQVVKLKSMLNLESKDDVVMVGIWGQGGIGKTTLAKAIYNSIYKQFDGSCFLSNVREASKSSKDLIPLQAKLLTEILSPQQGLVVSNVDGGVDGGISLIQHRLGSKRVLVILDDVDDLRQLDALVGEGKFYGNGSRIIITTRDKHLLTCHGINPCHVYEVTLLGHSKALELLCRHAFRTQQKSEIKKDLVDDIVNYASGLPLALVVLGSFLHDKGEDVWKSTLKKLSEFPKKEINNVLKISYDGLEEGEKEIFLHIVCFFKGKNSRDIKKVLDDCDLAATSGLKVLEDRALISTKEFGVVNVHDLIQVMGIHIVNEEKDPGRRSRLWMYDDVKNVLQRDMGDCAVEAIVLKLLEPTEIYFDHDAFEKLRRLKLLILRNVHNSFHSPIYLPSELRWIELTECNWRPDFSSSRREPARFGMSNRSITRMSKPFEEFRKLKHITLDGCNSLVSTPDVSSTPNLEELHLRGCERLVEAHRSIAYHDKLQILIFSDCSKFRVFPKVLESKNLQKFKLIHCPKFENFPNVPHKLRDLKELQLFSTSVKKLPASIENLVSLELMELENCKGIMNIPCTIYKLQELRRLVIRNATIRFPKQQISTDLCMEIGLPKLTHLILEESKLSEVEFLEDLSCFPLLRELHLSRNNITSLPTSLSKRDNLSLLWLDDCRQLQEIPKLPPFLECLEAEGCNSLPTEGPLTIIDSWVRGASLAQDSFCYCHHPGGKIPKWFRHMENGSISFRASEELYNKFLGFIICVVSNGKHGSGLYFETQFEGKCWGEEIDLEMHLKMQAHSDCILLAYVPPSYLRKVVDFRRINGSYAQFSFKLWIDKGEKYGLRIVCKRLNNRLQTEIRNNRLIDRSLLYEIGDNLTNLEAGSSQTLEDSLIEVDQRKNSRDCQVSTKEQTKTVREGDPELSSLEACRPRSRRLLIRLIEMSMAVFGCCICCRKRLEVAKEASPR